MTKEKLALEVIKRLKTAYPRTDCTLEYDEAWKLLVSVRLAAQCTDARVNVVVVDLFKKYPSIEALADADVSDIEEIVRPCGLGKSKARDISACMRMLRDDFGGLVPDNMTDLLKLPGVGRKSANLIMGDVYGKPAIVTALHTPLQPYRTYRWNKGSEKGRDGALENHTARGEQRLLPQACGPWTRRMYCTNHTAL